MGLLVRYTSILKYRCQFQSRVPLCGNAQHRAELSTPGPLRHTRHAVTRNCARAALQAWLVLLHSQTEVIRGSETAVVGLSMRRSRWGTRGVYVGKLVAIRRPSQIRPTFREVPPKRYTASSSHGSDRVLACSSDGRRCTGRSANAI